MRTLSKPSTAKCTVEHYAAFLLAEPQSAGCVRLAEVAGGAFAHDAANRFLNREEEKTRNGIYSVNGILQSSFRPASRRETLGRHSEGGRRGGGLKIDWTKPLPSARPMCIDCGLGSRVRN